MNSHAICHSFVGSDCGDLSAPSNGQISINATTFGSMATYSCDLGYTLDGNTSRTCQSNGQWSGSQPSCNGEWSLLIIKQNMYHVTFVLFHSHWLWRFECTFQWSDQHHCNIVWFHDHLQLWPWLHPGWKYITYMPVQWAVVWFTAFLQWWVISADN